MQISRWKLHQPSLTKAEFQRINRTLFREVKVG
jgi:hypothetical protein